MVDLLPEVLQRWQAVEAKAREHFQRSGFGEIRTPLLETTDLFCRGIGEGTDVVGKEMYTFQDRGDRSCTLRPEGTDGGPCCSSARFVESTQGSGYAGRCFTSASRPAGRQFIQIELSGLARSGSQRCWVIALAWDLLASLGVGGCSWN